MTYFTSDFLGTASAATTDGNVAPSYGLAYDLATGSWANAAQFQQFVRDVLPVTQQKAQAAAKQDQFNSAHWKELQLAQTHDQYGFALSASPDEARAYSRGNDLTKGLLLGKKAFGIIKNSAESVASAVIGHETSLPDHPYEEYTKNGGLLSEEEFNALGENTQLWLLNRKATGHTLGNLADVPGIKQGLEGLGAAYTGLTAGAEMLPTQSIPVLGSWLAMTGNDKIDKRRNPLSGSQWQQAWKEAQGDSLGNAMMNTVLDPYASQETLDRWKRDNPFYQMTSVGAEIAATWYLDPTVIAGKGLGAASRFHRGEFPIREMSNPAIALRQATQRQAITVRNPVTKAYAKVQARRIDNNWGDVEKAATQMSDAEFAQLPMFRQMYRAQDGGAAAYALHWAANNKAAMADAIGPHVDLFDLTRQLTMGDNNAYAMLNKLKTVPPEELQRIAPGAGTLLDTMDALKTKATVLQQETDDLLREADAIEAGTSTSKALPMFHRWEVHTSLADKQKQLGEATTALQKYDGYQNFLDLASKEPILSRVQGPSKARFSEIRNRPGTPETDQRFTFHDNPFGFAHSLYKMPKSLFVKRANTVEIHSMDSGLMSINRQFDQLDHMFGYAPDGARADTLRSYVRAESAASPEYERYKILHSLEETHLAQAISHRFGIEPDMANTILQKIHTERDRSIQGILSGEGAVYRSAPALADRLTGGSDASLKLIDRNPEAGTVNVKLMNGRHVQEFEIPEAALERRVAPEDVTQTPNYYNPLDTRRLYHQLKHDPNMLEELNAGWLRDKAAAAVHTGEYVGNKFNELWKPIQLFRLGWPMRVLMDEGARATAIFGPMYWITGAGGDSVRTVAHNVVPNVLDATARKKHGPLGVSMGAGPVTGAAEQAPSQFLRDAEVRDAVQIPQELWSTVDPARLQTIKDHFDRFDTWERGENRRAAWRREGVSGSSGIIDHAIASGQPLTPLQSKLVEYGYKQSTSILNNAELAAVMQPLDSPVYKAARAYFDRRGTTPLAQQIEEGPLVHDPARGTQHRTGYVISLPDTAAPLVNRYGNSVPTHDLLAWYNHHSELLSRGGMRIVTEGPDGTIAVGRHFPANRRKAAQEFAQYVSEKHPGVKMWDIGNKVSHVVQDANDLSPISQASHRYFVNEEKTALVPGAAPVEGEPSVYHGTNQTLPEDLLPRDDVPVWNGNMLGAGLYTTVSRDTAETYGAHNLYTVRGSKSGKTHKTWDTDQPITPEQIESLRTHLERDPYMDPRNAETIMDFAKSEPHEYHMTAVHPSNKQTWANLYENISYDAGLYRAVDKYLEDVHGVGAKTHLGGTRHGHPHQVYVFMHPEDTIVKPAYGGTGEFHSLPTWFSHPESIEQVMPENRIIRKGQRNPMLRELRTISNKLEGNFNDLPGFEIEALQKRERALMDALGLERRSGIPELAADTNHTIVPHRYVVADNGHFNRMVDEARTEDQAHAAKAAANGELRAQEVANQNPQFDLGDFDASIDSPLDWLFHSMRDKRSQGAGWKVIASSDGKSVVVPSAFEGHSGQLVRALTASNGALDVLSEGHGGGSSMFRRKVAGHRVYAPPVMDEKALSNVKSTEFKKAVRYYQVYADTVNDHFGNSPIIQRMIRGLGRPDEAVNDEITHWLDHTTEGQRVRNNVKPKELPTGVWVDDHRYKFNYMVPSRELQRRLGKGRLDPSDFRKKVADEDRPHVYGPDLELLDRRRGMGRFMSDWADHAWEWLGNKPIDAFSRHPFAQAMYDTKMKNLIASTDSEHLGMDTIERYQRQAHTFALNEVRRHLYNLTETTNFNDALRFIAPFWGAQYEAISKWLRIISDRPETVGRFFAAQKAIYKNMVVVDPTNDHKEVHAGMRPGGLHGLGMYHPEDQVIMQVPEFVQKKFGLKGIGTVGIPLGSANTVLQGELPLLPSFGPFMTIPADLLMKQASDTYGVENDQNLLYRWLFPIGRPRSKDTPNRVLDGLLPGWANRFRQSSGPEDTQARFNMETLIGREMTLRARKLGKPDPTPAEIEKAANHLWNVRIVSGLVMPFQTQLFPDHQYWIDAANSYRKQYGVQWWDKFIDKYGEEAAIFATSSSNSIGVPPTSKGMEEWSKNKDLIQKFPNWTSAIISPQAYMGQFSSDAYGQQFDITLGPGDARALRTGSSLQDRLHTDPDTQLGWREYRKLNAAIEAELHNRGLTNIGDRGAEDLAQIKAAAKNDIATKYPAWQRAFESQATTINSDVAELKKLAPNPMFDNRPDWQGVRQYLAMRQDVTDRLDANYGQGGSRSLQAQENGALRDWFYRQVGQLILDNPSFAEFYSRYLDNDTLTTGSGF